MTYPRHDEPVPESALPAYLEQARKVFADACTAEQLGEDATTPLVSADFEHLRWFELPAACLSSQAARVGSPGS
jgi:hypothetical protein